jgi:hypothetical protein
LQFSTGGSNIAIGNTAGYFAGTLASHVQNIFIGNNSGQYSVGLSNLGMGQYTLYRITGQDNVAIGSNAYVNSNATNGTGSRNIAIGMNAIASGSGIAITGTDNCAGGYKSIKALTSGTFNSAWGANSLLLLTSGANNVAVGYLAGDTLTTGSNNTILGSGSDTQASTDVNSIAIGKGAVGLGSNTTVIGVATTTATKLFGSLSITGNTINIPTQNTPASATAVGTKGDIVHDTDYIYVCIAANTWKRTAISTW